MNCILLVVLGTALGFAAPAAPQNGAGLNNASQNSGKDKATKEKKSSQSALTGCLDEQDGRYVLLEEKTVRKLADLQADGFAEEGFAKYMGQKVTVRGQVTAVEGRSVFRVRAVETVAAQCTAAGQF
jgi:hypothetical protein